MINAQVGDLSSHTTKYTSSTLTQKVFENMRRVGKVFSGVDTPLFGGILVPQQAQNVEVATEDEDAANEVSAKPTPPSPTPATPPPPPQQEHIPSPPQAETAQPSSPPPQQPLQNAKISMTLLNQLLETLDAKEDIDSDVQGRLSESQAKVYHLDLEHADKVLSMQDTDEAVPAEVEEVIKVVTAANLMTKVVTTAATAITATQFPKAKYKSKDKGKGILVEEPKPLKRQEQIEQDEAFDRELEAELNANIKWNMMEEITEQEGSKIKDASPEQRAAKKQRIYKEEEELKRHLQIVVNDDDDVFTEATPLALKVPVVDYQIYYENNKPFYKIIRADRTHKLFLSFITLLKKFDREDLEMLWKLIQERFQSSKPKNFSDDFLLNTFKIMFEKPNVKANT
uniref:Uncharacterized protein n=1 Tax=Tanacetum cinerariifolium TaxID=118510 RepID=A0A6L2JUM8_TANCI|nr:hypothetical protein [Tanacetum cinerariifolium]